MRSLTDNQSVDVFVVGLGPAGASAAAAAAAAGRSVLAVDRKRRAGQPVQCAEFVPALLTQELDFLDQVTHQPITRMVTVVEAEYPDVKPDFPGRMIDRERFDAALVAQAEQAGADCRFGVSVEAIQPNGIVQLVDGTQVEAKVIIGADGPRSRVGKAIGVVNRDIVETRQITVPLLTPHDSTDIFLGADIPGGYGWLFPKEDVANLGLGVAAKCKRELKPLLDQLHAALVANGLVGARVLGYTGGMIPVGGLVGTHDKLGDVQVLLAGDAAGLTNPITGAGISAATISGELSGDAAAAFIDGDGNAADDYADEIDELFGSALAHARRRREEILSRYAESTGPSAADLRQGWIAYPEYWAAEESVL